MKSLTTQAGIQLVQGLDRSASFDPGGGERASKGIGE
jgi:hypothetical protein